MKSDYPTIWFLRHGETEWNADRRIQGQLDSPLTAKGRADAQSQAEIMAPLMPSAMACYVSPLGRAQETARIALGGASFQTDARLAEADAGAWQGRLRDEILRDHPALFTAQTPALDLFLAAPGGESFARFRTRIAGFLAELTGPSVIVAHGLWGQVMRGLIRGLHREEMGHLPNEQACVYLLENGAETCLRAPRG